MIPEGEPNSGSATPSMTDACRNALVAARAQYLKLIEMP